MTIGRSASMPWRPAISYASWRRSALCVITASLILVVIVLGARRLMGALSDPLPAGLLLAAMALAALATIAIRWLWLSDQPDHWAIRWLPTALLILLASALSLPETSSGAVAGACAIVAGNLALQRGMRLPRSPLPNTAPYTRLSPEITQTFTRRTLPSGEEIVEGVCRASLTAGQRIENYHVAFCPAFASSPRVTCQQVEGSAARIKVAQVLPQGMRIELRLEETSTEAATIVLQFQARSGTDIRDGDADANYQS